MSECVSVPFWADCLSCAVSIWPMTLFIWRRSLFQICKCLHVLLLSHHSKWAHVCVSCCVCMRVRVRVRVRARMCILSRQILFMDNNKLGLCRLRSCQYDLMPLFVIYDFWNRSYLRMFEHKVCVGFTYVRTQGLCRLRSCRYNLIPLFVMYDFWNRSYLRMFEHKACAGFVRVNTT